MESQFDFQAVVAAKPTTAQGIEVPPMPGVPSTAFAPEVPVVAPQEQYCGENINVFAESISSSSSDSQDQAVFDIVLSVTWTCPQSGEYKTSKIVKSISFNKTNLLGLTSNQPVAVVEDIQAKHEKMSKAIKNLRELAGVPGFGNFV
jgi:hypothetical protein